MNISDLWHRFIQDTKENTKKKLDIWQNKLRDTGWYASGFKSFAKLGKFIETTWESIQDDQKTILNNTLLSISYLKLAINFIALIFNSMYNAIQIKQSLERKRRLDKFNNTVRVARIINNLATIGLSIAIVALFNPVTLVLSAVFNLSIKILNIIKTARSYVRLNKEYEALKEQFSFAGPTAEQELDLKWRFHGLKRRQWRIGRRLVAIAFAVAILAIVISSLIVANPMLIGALIIVGIASTVSKRFLRYIKDRLLNPIRPIPKLHVMTQKELNSSYQKALLLLEHSSKAYGKNKSSTILLKQKTEYQIIKNDIQVGMVDKKWTLRMYVIDFSLLAVVSSLAIVAISIASGPVFIAVAMLAAALLVAKIIMHTKQYKEKAVIQVQSDNCKGLLSQLEVQQPKLGKPFAKTTVDFYIDKLPRTEKKSRVKLRLFIAASRSGKKNHQAKTESMAMLNPINQSAIK